MGKRTQKGGFWPFTAPAPASSSAQTEPKSWFSWLYRKPANGQQPAIGQPNGQQPANGQQPPNGQQPAIGQPANGQSPVAGQQSVTGGKKRRKPKTFKSHKKGKRKTNKKYH
jgi:hypothetical protein